jgi:hypothetical protein
MSELSGRNKPKNQLAEAESEIYKSDGSKKLINLLETTWEKRTSGVQWASIVDCIPTIKHQFNWLQPMLIWSLRVQFRRMQKNDQFDGFPGLKCSAGGFQNHQLEEPENFGTYLESSKQTSSQNPGNPRSQRTTAKRVFPWVVQKTQLLRQ